MNFPSNEDCYHAMSQFSYYYMAGEQQAEWLNIITEGLKSGRCAPGKAFLYELDKVINISEKPSMPRRIALYELICTVSI